MLIREYNASREVLGGGRGRKGLEVELPRGVQYYLFIYLFLTATGLTPDGSSTVHIHVLTKSTQNTENGTYITIKKIGKCGPCPVFVSYTLVFALQLRKNHGKISVRVVEKCPDIPVEVVKCNKKSFR
jgi:hypothetical protein